MWKSTGVLFLGLEGNLLSSVTILSLAMVCLTRESFMRTRVRQRIIWINCNRWSDRLWKVVDSTELTSSNVWPVVCRAVGEGSWVKVLGPTFSTLELGLFSQRTDTNLVCQYLCHYNETFLQGTRVWRFGTSLGYQRTPPCSSHKPLYCCRDPLREKETD